MMAAKLGLATYDRELAGALMRLMYEDSGEEARGEHREWQGGGEGVGRGRAVWFEASRWHGQGGPCMAA